MGFDQYHEPPEELSAETRTFARLCASLKRRRGDRLVRAASRGRARRRRAGDHARRPGGGVQALLDGPRVPAAAQPALARDRRGRALPGRRHRRARRGRRGGFGRDDRRRADQATAARSGSAASRGRDDEPPAARPRAALRLELEAARRRGARAPARAAGGAPPGRLHRAARLGALGHQPRPGRDGRGRPRTASPRRSAGSCRWSRCGSTSPSSLGELRDDDRGAVDVDLEQLDDAAHQIALAENGAVFHGWAKAGIGGIAEASPFEPEPLGAAAELPALGRRARSRGCARRGSRGPTASRSVPTSTPR